MLIAKLARPEDFEAYYYLKCDRENIKWTGHDAAPDKNRLHAWYLENINKENRYFFLFFEPAPDHKVVGYLYLDIVDDDSNTVDTGYGVHSNYTGKGYGTQIINYALKYAKASMSGIKYFQAWIASDNVGSIKVVLKNGLYKVPETKEVQFPKGEKKVFEKYALDLTNPLIRA